MNDTCSLCGLPLPSARISRTFAEKPFSFCCNGCSQVFRLLWESSDSPDPVRFKESEVFRKCREMGIIPSAGNMARVEDTKAIPPVAGEKLSLHGRVVHMWCPACAWLIEAVLKKTRGVAEASCNFSTERLRCVYNPALTSPSRILLAVAEIGYGIAQSEDAWEAAKKAEFVRFCISAFLTANVMMLSFALYSGFFHELAPEAIRLLSFPVAFLSGIVFFYGGGPIHRKALSGIASGRMGMETLITTGALSALVLSTVNLVSGSLHLYYDTSAMLITLTLLGKMLEANAKDGIRKELDHLFFLRPLRVRICTEAYPVGRYVPAAELRREDLFRVVENEIVSADGRIVSGTGRVDESSLTGEAVPVRKRPGDRIRSGTRILAGDFSVRVEAAGDDCLLGQMLRIMESALGSRTAWEGKTERLLGRFVPAVFVVAAATALGCLAAGLPVEASVIRAVTVMVISCPCALGIAIPLVRVAAVSLAAKNGILVRNFSSFQRIRHVTAFVFDKTGTVTRGDWRLRDIQTAFPFSEKEALSLAAGLEKDCDHPIASGILRMAAERGVRPAPIEAVRQAENGVTGFFGEKEIRIGSAGFIVGKLFPSEDASLFNPAEEAGISSVYLALDGRIVAVFRFGDALRPSSAQTMKSLEQMGYRLALVSGDGKKTVQAAAEGIGVAQSHGEMLPADKAAFIARLREEGFRVAMVGDGINDAPALARADLAVTLCSGNPLGNETADITLMGSDPARILDFLRMADGVEKKIAQNLWFSFLYNAIGIPAAAFGLLNPPLAALAMLASSLSVIGNTLLLTRNFPTCAVGPEIKHGWTRINTDGQKMEGK